MDADIVRAVLAYDASTGLFRWLVDRGSRARPGMQAGTPDREGYVVIRYAGKGYKAHRLAWLHVYGRWPNGPLDHINRLKNDNRIENLRETDDALNQHNVVATRARSGLRGVSWFSQYQCWKATIFVRGRKHFLGHYGDENEAHRAYLDARSRFGLPPL